jgi:mannose-6-phosphate isomerase
LNAEVRVLADPSWRGDVGALMNAADALDDALLVLNAYVFSPINYLALAALLDPNTQAVVAMHANPPQESLFVLDTTTKVVSTRSLQTATPSSLPHAGPAVFKRTALASVQEHHKSLEELLSTLAMNGALKGETFAAPTIDLRREEDRANVSALVQRALRRGAAFFDRDGTLNLDAGYTHKPQDLQWAPGAREAIRACNDSGHYVVVVTNQSGIARGYFEADHVARFHNAMQAELRPLGAHIDAFYFCPFHEEGDVSAFVVADHPDRKPNPGMVRRALTQWPIDMRESFLIGDIETDIECAARAGLPAIKVAPGELQSAVGGLLARRLAGSDGLALAQAALADRAARAKAWLFDCAFPFWWRVGFDHANGLFHERVDLNGAPVSMARRVRVQARQTYVYALAGDLGWSGPWRSAVRAGLDVLTKRALRADGGTFHMLGAAGEPIDTRRDLYDAAFVLFALAHGGRALGGDAQAFNAAAALAKWLEQNWSCPEGGFLEGDVATTPPRRQNPHMHLFEAYLALHQATGDPLWRTRAEAIVTLFTNRLFDHRYGALPEYFDMEWRRLASDRGSLCEPGHHFEWSWLLHCWRKVTQADIADIAERLRIHGEVYGVDPISNVTYDEVALNGAPRKRSARLWPQTERIKANLTRFEYAGDTQAALNAVAAFDTLMGYCDGQHAGLYLDLRLDDGSFVQDAAIASSLYHIGVALGELIRIGEP